MKALLDGLDLGSFGSLIDPVVTPGLALEVDPSSTASLRPGAAPVAGDDQPAPSAPGDADSSQGGADLPNTGGGAALVAIIAIAGALALARRRS